MASTLDSTEGISIITKSSTEQGGCRAELDIAKYLSVTTHRNYLLVFTSKVELQETHPAVSFARSGARPAYLSAGLALSALVSGLETSLLACIPSP